MLQHVLPIRLRDSSAATPDGRITLIISPRLPTTTAD
jgi:hypothetical protein